MPWPKGKKRTKTIDTVFGSSAAVADPVAKFTEFVDAPYKIKTKLALRVDKIMDGPFAGLYQLVTIDAEGREKVSIDANTKRFVIVRMHKLLMGVD